MPTTSVRRLDLAVEALEWIDGVDFRPVILGKVMKANALVHLVRSFEELTCH